MRFKKHERHIVIRSYTYNVADENLAERFGSVQRFREVLSHASDDEWEESQGEEPSVEELDALSDLTGVSASDVDDYWISDDKGGTEVSYEPVTDA